jgi:hypothetical protein
MEIANAQRCRLVVAGLFMERSCTGAGYPSDCPSDRQQNKFSAWLIYSVLLPGVGNYEMNMETLSSAIETAWQSAEQLRPQLLKAAGKQIEWGHAAYNHLYNLVESTRDKILT